MCIKSPKILPNLVQFPFDFIMLTITLLVFVLVPSYQVPLPQSNVKISDNGLLGFILHPFEDGDSAAQKAHSVTRRSYGADLRLASEYLTDDDPKEEMASAESAWGGHGWGNGFNAYGGFQGNGFYPHLPYPMNHHGPYPGSNPAPFAHHGHGFPGQGHQGNWGRPPCRGEGCDFRSGNGHGHGHVHGPGCGHEQVHGHGHGHRQEYGHGHGQGHGHHCNDENEEEHNFSGEDSGEEENVDVTNPTPIQTYPTRLTPSTVTTTTTTDNPVYDIDIRLGTGSK